jgi:hypothetical protein
MTAGTALAARGQLDAIMHEWLAPLVDRIGNLGRENGRLEAERDELRRRAEAAEAELSATRLAHQGEVGGLRRQTSPQPVSEAATGAPHVEDSEAPVPAGGFRARARRAFGGA